MPVGLGEVVTAGVGDALVPGVETGVGVGVTPGVDVVVGVPVGDAVAPGEGDALGAGDAVVLGLPVGLALGVVMRVSVSPQPMSVVRATSADNGVPREFVHLLIIVISSVVMATHSICAVTWLARYFITDITWRAAKRVPA